jgi:nucleoside 2-deoxyribosyltransferase
MWFAEEMNTVFENAIKPAIESEDCGHFTAHRVDKAEFNDDITDEIIAGIKECRFVVADLTGYRDGVYFEAGYAKGLGKPVIFK